MPTALQDLINDFSREMMEDHENEQELIEARMAIILESMQEGIRDRDPGQRVMDRLRWRNRRNRTSQIPRPEVPERPCAAAAA